MQSTLLADHILFARKKWRLRPEWKVRRRHAEKTQPEITGEAYLITQVKQEVCSRDQPEAHSLSEGSGCDPEPGPWAPSGVGWAEGSSSGCPSPGSAATNVLCYQEACFLPSTLLLLSSLFPWFSRLPPARLETQASQDLPRSPWAVLSPPSSFSAGLMGCLVFITEIFLARSFLHSWWWDAQGN